MPCLSSKISSGLTAHDANAYLHAQLIVEQREMTKPERKESEIPDEEVEDILDMQAPKDLVREFRKAAQESPLLVTGLAFAFGLLVGVSLSSGRRRS